LHFNTFESKITLSRSHPRLHQLGELWAMQNQFDSLIVYDQIKWEEPGRIWRSGLPGSAALKYTIPGDAPLIDREEVETLLWQDGQSTSLRR
jgi:hypothetical protein